MEHIDTFEFFFLIWHKISKWKLEWQLVDLGGLQHIYDRQQIVCKNTRRQITEKHANGQETGEIYSSSLRVKYGIKIMKCMFQLLNCKNFYNIWSLIIFTLLGTFLHWCGTLTCTSRNDRIAATFGGQFGHTSEKFKCTCFLLCKLWAV